MPSTVQEELIEQLARSCRCEAPCPAYVTTEQRTFLDHQISLLVNAGLLSRQVRVRLVRREMAA